MILVSMERGDPILYHGTKHSYVGLVNFKFIRGVVTTHLVNHVTKKDLVGRGLKVDFLENYVATTKSKGTEGAGLSPSKYCKKITIFTMFTSM